MADKEPEVKPVGSRTSRPHAEDGWGIGGRDDENAQNFDPKLAEKHAKAHKDRKEKK